MRASAGVSLLVASSMAIFGIYGRQRSNAALPPGPEPVWVNGVMGVYNPDTAQFVPSTSPLFDQTCDLIQCRREQAQGYPCNGNFNGNGGGMVYHHWTYFPSSNSYSYWSGGASGAMSPGGTSGAMSSGGASGARSSDGDSSSHIGSVRGGIGETGHSFGGGHS